MSILIKGAKMPDTSACWKCDFCYAKYTDDDDIETFAGCEIYHVRFAEFYTGRDVELNEFLYADGGYKYPKCDIVEVPPHGDLIDREELQHIIGQFSLNWEYGQGVSDCWDALLDAPTIIEAEDEV